MLVLDDITANIEFFQMEKLCKDRTDLMVCLMEKRQSIENDSNGGTCKRYLKSMAVVFFSDYHLIHGFVDSCSEDVQKLSCGVISNSADEKSSTQVIDTLFVGLQFCWTA
jgi:hypothetical protein